MKVAVVGSTGLVGQIMLKVLEERAFPVTELLPVASEQSIGRKITFNGTEHNVGLGRRHCRSTLLHCFRWCFCFQSGPQSSLR